MTDAPPRKETRWTWLVLCVLLAGIAVFITARLPVNFQKPGITSLWLAGLIGGVVAWLARENGVSSTRFMIGLATTLGIVSAIGLTGQRYWMYRQLKTDEYLGDLNGSGTASPDAMNLFTENSTPPPNLREQFRADREAALEKLLPFDVYLATRLSAFGIGRSGFSKTMVMALWGVEIIVAGVAAGLLARVVSGSSTMEPQA